MKKNRYGILEPKKNNIIAPKELDIIIVPLVAFDKKCYRVGKGAGYYDKTFLKEDTDTKKKLIGIAYDLQQIEEVPKDSWDIQLFGVVTESNFFSYK